MQWLGTKEGTRRTRTRFALFPTYFGDRRKWVWLEFYRVVQEYTLMCDGMCYGFAWKDIKYKLKGDPL